MGNKRAWERGERGEERGGDDASPFRAEGGDAAHGGGGSSLKRSLRLRAGTGRLPPLHPQGRDSCQPRTARSVTERRLGNRREDCQCFAARGCLVAPALDPSSTCREVARRGGERGRPSRGGVTPFGGGAGGGAHH
ncbi:hypothetical protein I4F81_001451 [Pyropia yezoensis]|uniref:Uncharacterized protein n=1 Tax=Pyropia yezoensis TaxID=2788 RepID=A0ACC3BM86_PYRYE|nr:hypothetical protein I4F81_001451 [Neopyropia yezoensis]